MNTPVSFELAKLLKEKKFGLSDEDYIQLPRFYEEDGNYIEYDVQVSKKYNSSPNHLGADTIKDFEAHLTMMDNSLDNICLAPTIAEVVMWLYEKHGIWIAVTQELGATITFCYQVMGEHISATYKAYFKSPTEAYEAAIEYTLKNLL